MSYTSHEATQERRLDIELARNTFDSDKLHKLAQLEKEAGNDELAEELYMEALKIDQYLDDEEPESDRNEAEEHRDAYNDY
jgi:hypothetical protein